MATAGALHNPRSMRTATYLEKEKMRQNYERAIQGARLIFCMTVKAPELLVAAVAGLFANWPTFDVCL